MAYVVYNENTHIIEIFEERTLKGVYSNLGEMLFSFLEIDLTEYNTFYKLYCFKNNITYSDIQHLMSIYPKTADSANYIFELADSNTPSAELRNFLLPFLLDNQDTFDFLHSHPAFALSDTIIDGPIEELKDIIYDCDFYELQQTIKTLLDFCYFNENKKINILTPEERYFLLLSTKTKYLYRTELHQISLCIPQFIHEDTKKRCENYLSEDLLNLDDELIDNVKNQVKVKMMYECKTVRDFLFFEFYCLLTHGFKVKKCINCGKPFIPIGNYKTDCCDRIQKPENASCKKIMAQKRRKEKVNNNPILKEYNKAYKRMYARVKNGAMSNDDFLIWSNSASQKRDSYVEKYDIYHSQEVLDEFKIILGNR